MVADSKKGPLDYLNPDEIAQLRLHNVTASKTALTFSKKLNGSELRNVWRVVSAIVRRRPPSDDWVNWLIGDWLNEAAKTIGEEPALQMTKDEDEAHQFSQHLLTLAGGTLLSLQLAEVSLLT